MRVARVRQREHDRAGVGLRVRREHVFERHVEAVRAVIVAPAHVQPDAFALEALGGEIDRGNHVLGERHEIVERTLGEEVVTFHGEIGCVDLQQTPASIQAWYSCVRPSATAST